MNKANAAFKSMLKKCCQEGKGVVQHKNPIQAGKINKILYKIMHFASNMIMMMSIYSIVKHTFDFNFVHVYTQKPKE
jgi:hypothetical protein